MWYEKLAKNQTWASLWSDYVICGGCSSIRLLSKKCDTCGVAPVGFTNEFQGPLTITYMGAEGRYEDYIYLQMLQREWERPTPETPAFAHLPKDKQPSARAAFVLLFWSYLETRIERLLRASMRSLPAAVSEELLSRHSSIGARLTRLPKILFGTNYFDDLEQCGYSDVAELIRTVHHRRNEFAHGHPEVITDSLVEDLAENLKKEHEAWIAVFNKRLPRAN